MTYTKDQLIEALYNEYVYLCHDDFDPDNDATPEEYLEMLKEMSCDELVEETQTDEEYHLEEFMEAWG
jgi:L-ascorbate metabolism protein UlaG (beta-lactamase superfamily)